MFSGGLHVCYHCTSEVAHYVWVLQPLLCMNNPYKPDQKQSLTVLLTVLSAKGHLSADDLLVQWTR